ncbi:MAG: Zn-dependent alcohol dehydrogenase [Spirochaetaceae bacterium]|nr:Zn-dependent alcohol dehydrogenase [Myxococcales bacterium]MCB9724330.1 Zn-dependent alcohol dehydrogenase [Spirochaetaceae bacterium]HPG24983.1 Zn-dependent alcohol dehydrogenase [Myxococcota bacterium]
MRAAVLHEKNTPLVVEDVDVEAPRQGEVLVRIAASGVCRSDLHAQEGESPVSKPPLVLGHEGAGIVEEVGPGVTGLAQGDPVVIALYGPCGTCDDCRAGDIPNCWSETRTHNMYGRMPDGSTRLRLRGEPIAPMVGSGSLAELSVVREAQLVKIDRDIPLDLACLAGCGVTTGIGAALNIARVAPGSSVAVIGCGGVGLNVIQGARIAGAARILAVDTQPGKLDLAADLGATDGVLVAPGESAAEAIRARLPRGVDYAFEVVGHTPLVREAFEATRIGGTAVMVGAPPPGSTITIDSRQLFADRRLLGCTGGGNIPARDIPRIMRFYQQGRLDLERLVATRIPLARVNEAFDSLRRGEAVRTVVLP